MWAGSYRLAITVTWLRYAYCVVHNQECCVKRKVAMMNLTGTICTAHSAMGLGEKESAITWAYFLIWVGHRRLLEEPLIMQECVDTFPRDKMSSLLPQYDFTWCVLSPHLHGWPIRRIRQWCVWPVKQPHVFNLDLFDVYWHVINNDFWTAKTCLQITA